MNLVDRVNAIVLSGGSAFGLDTASGVVRYLELVRGELQTLVGLAGARTIDEIERSMVARAGEELGA